MGVDLYIFQNKKLRLRPKPIYRIELHPEIKGDTYYKIVFNMLRVLSDEMVYQIRMYIRIITDVGCNEVTKFKQCCWIFDILMERSLTPVETLCHITDDIINIIPKEIRMKNITKGMKRAKCGIPPGLIARKQKDSPKTFVFIPFLDTEIGLHSSDIYNLKFTKFRTVDHDQFYSPIVPSYNELLLDKSDRYPDFLRDIIQHWRDNY